MRAAVCYNDLFAFDALRALGECVLRAGRDFALMGFDNVVDAEHSNPPLSTVDIQQSARGEHAAEMLLQRIERPEAARQLYLAQPRLMLRDSA